MVDYLAPKWGAMLVFPEERYYGTSLPFGDASFRSENLKYLTTEQILEDYVELITHLKNTIPNASNCPVVAFGGSYGGTLTTFLRAKYPATVIGGLASSAPIGYYDKEGWAAHGVDEFTWSDIVTRDYAEAHPQCLKQISAAMTAIESTPESSLIKAFGVCEASGLGPTAPSELFAYALESQPQLDYPYPVGALPAWPVNATCHDLVAAGSSKEKLVAAAADITAKVVGKPPNGCIPTLTEGPGEVPGDGPGDDTAWGWQSCTENLHQFSARGAVRSYTCATDSHNFHLQSCCGLTASDVNSCL
jgi:pimeloyl-ACP methyl ester carboxylesterase|eukprot:COSAG02_NODE_3775_length_6252_cov_3.764505_3_plen_304_part_00